MPILVGKVLMKKIQLLYLKNLINNLLSKIYNNYYDHINNIIKCNESNHSFILKNVN